MVRKTEAAAAGSRRASDWPRFGLQIFFWRPSSQFLSRLRHGAGAGSCGSSVCICAALYASYICHFLPCAAHSRSDIWLQSIGQLRSPPSRKEELFEKVKRLANSKLENHQHVNALLTAVTSVIQAKSEPPHLSTASTDRCADGPLNATSYFGVLLSLLSEVAADSTLSSCSHPLS